MKRHIAATAAVLFCLAAPTQAQNQTPPKPSICETDPHFRDFDFWVGDWTVSGFEDGTFQGTNRITRMEGGCMLREEWRGNGGGTGQSINYYNPVTGKWRQVWTSAGAGGYLIDYEGGLDKAGAMVLEGTITYYGARKSFPFRGTWTPNADGSVRQMFEQYDPRKESWQVWFDGLYEHQQNRE